MLTPDAIPSDAPEAEAACPIAATLPPGRATPEKFGMMTVVMVCPDDTRPSKARPRSPLIPAGFSPVGSFGMVELTAPLTALPTALLIMPPMSPTELATPPITSPTAPPNALPTPEK